MMVRRPRRTGQAGLGLIETAVVTLLVGTFVIGSLYTIATQSIQRDAQPAATATVDRSISGSLPCAGPEIEAYARDTLHLTMTPSGFRSTSGDPDLAEPKRSDFGPANNAEADTKYREAVAAWKVRLQGVVDAAKDPLEKKCKDLQASRDATNPPHPPEENLGINGTYTTDNHTVQAIGGCGGSGTEAKDAPYKLNVSWDGRASDAPTVIVTLAGGGSTTFDHGPTFDINGYHVDLTRNLDAQTTANLNGNFYTVGDRLEFNGEYSTLSGPGGCGYTFVAPKDVPATPNSNQ
jgi:hypothetical protein